MKKKWIGLLLAAALCLSVLGGCGESSTQESAESQALTAADAVEDAAAASADADASQVSAEEADEAQGLEAISYTASEENVKMLGRTYLQKSTLWLAYSASGIEFEVTGSSVSIDFTGDSVAFTAHGEDENCARVAIYVDGARVADEMMNEQFKTITLWEDEMRTATVQVVKLSETAMSTVGISAINVTEGSIAPTAQKDLYIEFIGDSITCGYGVDDEDRTHSFSTTTEDATKTYAYKTAAALDADYSLVSISGYGVLSGYSSDGSISASQIMSKYYDKIGFSYGTSGGESVSSWDWDFERQPDVVIINLGTNDASYCGSDTEKCEAFRDAYVELLELVREKNPDAVILCTLGIMGDDLYSYIEEAVALYSEASGDANVDLLHFDTQSFSDGIAADWHPTEATHEKAAAKLTEKLQELLGID